MEEALENIKDAVEGYIKVLTKHNRKIPMEFSEFHHIEVFKKKMPAHSRLKQLA